MAASEAVPFIKTGGLADVIGALPAALDKEKFDVKVFIPKYLCIKEDALKDCRFLKYFYIECPKGRQYVGLFEKIINGVSFILIDNEYYFNGSSPYGDMKWDIEKFCYFDLAVIASLKETGFCPDIIHCHDWQSALIPLYLKTKYGNDSFFAKTKTVFTIHNLRFQGVYDIDTLKALTGLPDEFFTVENLEAWGNANMMKGAFIYADRLTTVSPSYAEEIMTAEYGEGLDGVLRDKKYKLSGIVNGIDYDAFDPSTDRLIKYNYDISSFRQKKKKNKEELQKKLGLHADSRKIVIGMVSRLTDQKGLDLLLPAMDEILDEQTQFVVLGTGEKRYEDMFRYYAEKYPDRMSANIMYSEDLANKIYAGADVYLMPSAFEPCGLSQLIALRYGTVPVVRETGGLKDTVEAYNEYESSGNGFSFCNYSTEDMMKILNYSKEVFFKHKKEWNLIAERAMKSDYSWAESAKKYEKLYTDEK